MRYLDVKKLIILSCLLPLYAYSNNPPVVDSVILNPLKVSPGKSLTITLNAHDPDCPGTCTSGCGLYIVSSMTQWSSSDGQFSFINNGTNSSPYTTSATWIAPSYPGTQTITVFLADSGGMICGGRQTITYSIPVSVIKGEPPSITSFILQPSRTKPDGIVRVIVKAVDDGSALFYSFSSSSGSITVPEPDKPNVALWRAPKRTGTYDILVTVTDEDNNQTTDSRRVEVIYAYPAGNIKINSKIMEPSHISADFSGNIFIADEKNNLLYFFNPAGVFLKEWEFEGIGSVDVSRDGRIFITSHASGCVYIYNIYGEYEGEAGCGILQNPVDVEYSDNTDELYVSDISRKTVDVFSGSGGYLFSIGGFSLPGGIGVSGDKVAVVDEGEKKVKIYKRGVLIYSWGTQGNNEGNFVRPHDVRFDKDGLLLVSDIYLDRVQVFTEDGLFVGEFGKHGVSKGNLMNPGDIGVDGFGRIFVASQGSGRVEIFSTCPDDSDCDGMDDSYEISNNLNPWNPEDSSFDIDSDGLKNHEEMIRGTNPNNPDTDEDGMPDGEEILRGLNPLSPRDNMPVAVVPPPVITDPTVITLDPSLSYDPNGDRLTYIWRQIDGPEMVLEGEKEGSPQILVRKEGNYTFGLRVSDGRTWSREEVFEVHVNNVPPYMYFPPIIFTSTENENIISVSAGDVNLDPVTCFFEGEPVIIPLGNGCSGILKISSPGVYKYKIIVSDGMLEKEKEFTVYAKNYNASPPIAIGEAKYTEGKLILDARRSFDPEGEEFSVKWVQVEGPSVLHDGGFHGNYLEIKDPPNGFYRFRVIPEPSGLEDIVEISICGKEPVIMSAGNDKFIKVGEKVNITPAFEGGNGNIKVFLEQIEGAQAFVREENGSFTFYPVLEGEYHFQITGVDESGCVGRVRVNVIAEEDSLPYIFSKGVLCINCNTAELKAHIEAGENSTVYWVPLKNGEFTWETNVGERVLIHPSHYGVYAFIPVAVKENLFRTGKPVYLRKDSEEGVVPVALVKGGGVYSPGEIAIVDASNSYDPDGISLSFHWEYTGGDLPPLMEENGQILKVLAGKPGDTYFYRMYVSDENFESEPQIIWVGVAQYPIGVGKSFELKGKNIRRISFEGEIPEGFEIGFGLNDVEFKGEVPEGFSPLEGEIFLAPEGLSLRGELAVETKIPVNSALAFLRKGGEYEKMNVRVNGNKLILNIHSSGSYLLFVNVREEDLRHPSGGCNSGGGTGIFTLLLLIPFILYKRFKNEF